MIEPGTVLADRYRILRHIGSGAMGSVHLAEDQVLRRQVAVKRVHASPDSEEGKRIRREARLGAGLQHEGLVTVFDVLPDGEAVLLITEYVPGTTLADALGAGRFEPARALEVLRPLADALDRIHAAGVIHRDVKPANILLHERGAVKLADLGVATSDSATQITRTGSLVGTVAYMAPEQFEPGAATAGADVYALAAVAFEMLAGRRPYAGANAFEVMARARDEAPPDLREALPGAPAAAADALRRAMSRDPAARHVTARAFVDELEAAFRERPAAAATAAPPVPEEPGPPPTERLAATPPPAPGAPPPAPRRDPVPAPAAPAAPARSGRGSRGRPAAIAALVAALGVALALVLVANGDEGNGGGQAGSDTTATSTARTTATGSGGGDGQAPAPAPAAASPATPAGAVRAFYGRAAARDLDGAWAVAGPRMRATFGGRRERFAATLGTLREITFERLEEVARDGDRATLAIATTARHTTRTDVCTGTLAAVRVGDGWRVEPEGVRCRPA